MSQPLVIVTGKNGQLGHELQDASKHFDAFNFRFYDRSELDVADKNHLQNIFEQRPAYFINCAAYTAVDKAESDQENAYIINAEAAGQMAHLCYLYKTKFIHISTDYVFNGQNAKPYVENDATDPVNYYGYTKLAGEQLAMANNPGAVIIRTSWVYSAYGNNFVKTMLKLMKERSTVNVVSDQSGSPTYAKDIAFMILEHALQLPGGVYHFSNEGEISWYEFAVAIKEMKALSCNVNSIPTSNFPTPAKRPHYSVMDKTKIQNEGIALKPWKESLNVCLQKLTKKT